MLPYFIWICSAVSEMKHADELTDTVLQLCVHFMYLVQTTQNKDQCHSLRWITALRKQSDKRLSRILCLERVIVFIRVTPYCQILLTDIHNVGFATTKSWIYPAHSCNFPFSCQILIFNTFQKCGENRPIKLVYVFISFGLPSVHEGTEEKHEIIHPKAHLVNHFRSTSGKCRQK